LLEPVERTPHAVRPLVHDVYVLKKLAHRARWIVAQMPPTDAELEFLATGKLPGQESEEK
jgi:hypothetical protein